MKHDWIKIKDEYISAKSEALRTSLDSLATKYGISQNYLRTKSATDNWRLDAYLFISKIRKETARLLNKSVEEIALENYQHDLSVLELAKLASALLDKKL